METEDTVACPKLILASPRGNGKVVVLVRKITTIGRTAINDLVLPSELVSRRHAVLLCDGPNVTIRDLGSRNGTLVNGHRVKTQVLADRDMIEIGDFLVRYLGLANGAVPAELLGRSFGESEALPTAWPHMATRPGPAPLRNNSVGP